jgi:predicted amino acid racemase
VVGVTKGVAGMPSVARAMLDGGLETLADARLDNIARMRRAGIRGPIVLLRSPAISEAARCVELADASLNADLSVVKRLNQAVRWQRKRHGVVLMVDMNTGREGLAPDELPAAARAVARMSSLRLDGIGIYFNVALAPAQIRRRQAALVRLARTAGRESGVALRVVSGGSTNALAATVLTGDCVAGINHLRVGTAVLLGLMSSIGPKRIERFHHDAFTLAAELIEVKRRKRLLGILPFGHLDADRGFLFPALPGVRVVAVSSDHTVLDLTDTATPLRVGDWLRFHLGYYALARLALSPYVKVVELHPGA